MFTAISEPMLGLLQTVSLPLFCTRTTVEQGIFIQYVICDATLAGVAEISLIAASILPPSWGISDARSMSRADAHPANAEDLDIESWDTGYAKNRICSGENRSEHH